MHRIDKNSNKTDGVNGAICSFINRGYDLFPFTMDIHSIVSTHVEMVCLLSKKDK